MTPLLLLFVQVVHGEEPDPLHPLGGRVQQQLLFQSQTRTDGQTQPELNAHLPERPDPEPTGRRTLLHRIIPLCGCRLYLCLGPNQPKLNHLNLNNLSLNHLNLNLNLNQRLRMETKGTKEIFT